MEFVVSDLAVARGEIAVLQGVSFRVSAGHALILRGANGIGKTTLLRCLAGLQPAIHGYATASDAIAYAAHSDGVKSALSVTENLQFWAEVYGQTSYEAAIDAMNLRDLATRRAANLSAGQRRRLGLARLLVTGQPIWLLDEPTVSLDAQSVLLFAGVVNRHMAAGGIAVIATHIDLGFHAEVLDLTPFRALGPKDGGLSGAFDEAIE